MMPIPIVRFARLLAIATLAMAGCASSRPLPAGDARLLAPEDDAVAEEFNSLYRQGDVYFAGYPTEAGLREMSRRGVTTVVALKTPEQVTAARSFDETALAESLGIDLVWLPISPDSFSVSDVDRFAEVYERSSGPMLIHCGSANTVGGLWAEYLHRYRDLPLDVAMKEGRSVGLRRESMVEAVRRVAAEP
jgi:protein tyrosine phosphatase (PTP) superfamily phosphohydrolase (DUF442 family)